MMGSPFGVLSPSTFMNCTTQGIVSGFIIKHHNPPNSNNTNSNDNATENSTVTSAVILTDAKCHWGYEGGPAFDVNNRLVGVRSDSEIS